MDTPLLLYHVAGQPLYLALAGALRDAIHEGRLRPGERMPATRALAAELGVSRNTVVEAYDHLRAEGYVVGRQGSGTHVTEDLPLDVVDPLLPDRSSVHHEVDIHLSGFAQRALAAAPKWPTQSGPGPLYDFRYGTPSLEDFPMAEWRALTRQVLDYASPEVLGYGQPEGLQTLREQIAGYLRRSRGVSCDANDVLIVSGSQQAIDLVARCILNPGDSAVVEEPCYGGARAAFLAAGAELRPVPCDDQGLIVDAIPASSGARLIYVTPSHQFPSGAVLSASRRFELLAWAKANGAVIVEDDYCSEFRYDGRPLAALQGIDASGSVAYVGTLSKVLQPGLRVGYVVAPPALAPALRAAKMLADRHVPLLTQAVLALFMQEGHFDRHLRRMRKVYRARRDALLAALASEFGVAVHVGGSDGGMHVLLRIEGVPDPGALITAAARRDVRIQDARPYYAGEPPGACFLAGYSSVPLDRIPKGVHRLAEAWREVRA